MIDHMMLCQRSVLCHVMQYNILSDDAGRLSLFEEKVRLVKGEMVERVGGEEEEEEEEEAMETEEGERGYQEESEMEKGAVLVGEGDEIQRMY